MPLIITLSLFVILPRWHNNTIMVHFITLHSKIRCADIGSNNSGYYELQAVLTHKGRSSSSGHYVAWVKHKEDSWIKCDDSDVTPVSLEEILKLSGGGSITWFGIKIFIFFKLS